MVKILPDGEIVADDDPRLPQTNAAQRRQSGAANVSASPASTRDSSSSSWSFGLGRPAADGASAGGGIGAPSHAGSGAGATGREGGNDGASPRVESVTIFDLLNEKMIAAGFPRLNLGLYSVEPIAVVGTCFALLLFGLPGLILSLVLFFVVKFSRHGVPSLNDVAGGGRIDGGDPETRSPRQEGPTSESHQRSSEEEKWGAGQRLGGR